MNFVTNGYEGSGFFDIVLLRIFYSTNPHDISSINPSQLNFLLLRLSTLKCTELF